MEGLYFDKKLSDEGQKRLLELLKQMPKSTQPSAPRFGKSDKWRKRKATERQLSYMKFLLKGNNFKAVAEKLGIDASNPCTLTSGDASEIIEHLKANPKPKATAKPRRGGGYTQYVF